MTWARRMAERDLDCLLFGTAIVDPSFRFSCRVVGTLELDLAERAQLRGHLALALLAIARRLIAVSAANGAQTQATLLAKRVDRHCEKDLVAQLGAEVDHPSVEVHHVSVVVIFVGVAVRAFLDEADRE